MFTLANIKQQIGNALFFLLILAIVLDPTNTVLHLKDVFFVLLVGYSAVVFKPDFKYVLHILLVLGAVLAAYVFGEMQGSIIDNDKFVAVLKAFSPLVMLLWVRNYDVIKLSVVPSLLACLMIFVMYFIASSSEELEYALYLFFVSHDEMVLMGRRYFFGIQFFGLYLKSFVDLMFTLFLVFYYMYNSKRLRNKVVFTILSGIFTLAFFVSGTRSTMLLPLFMIGFVTYASVMKRRKVKYLVYPFVALGAMFFVMFVILLASEKGEASNVIKFAHLTSYVKLFSEHPTYLLFGQGPATSFYSEGFKRMTMETEWTYIELVRVYGMFSLLILYVVLSPMWRLWKYLRRSTYTLGIWGTYGAYLLIAGTNPLILSSTGMIMILAIYSYIEKVERDDALTPSADSLPPSDDTETK